MRWLFRTDYRSFYFLNITQFLGALNDNIFKLLVVFLLIHTQGQNHSAQILAMAGAVFVIPFLLFSSSAGTLADRISKRTIIVFTKALEVLIMLFGLFAMYSHSPFASYSSLFLMATQSAIFGPSKYGIIPELVEPKMVSKANGSLASFTYLAIILGSFLASFFTRVTHKNFVLVSCFCVVIAFIGLGTSLGISRTAPQNARKKMTPFFLLEIYRTLKMGNHIPHLLPAMFGSAFFLFCGAFTQLNLIPLGIQSLGLSETWGGYLFLMTAAGIALGAFWGGRFSKDKIELGVPCIAGFFIGFIFLLLYFFSFSLPLLLALLVILGIFGGAFMVPCETFLQINSPEKKRGQVIATSNFFGFFGVLCASALLHINSQWLNVSAAGGFFVMAILTWIATIGLSGRLSGLLFPLFIQRIFKRFYKTKLTSLLPHGPVVLMMQSKSWVDSLFLFSFFPKLQLLFPDTFFHRFPWINRWMETISIVPLDPDTDPRIEEVLELIKDSLNKNVAICLFVRKKNEQEASFISYRQLFEEHSLPLFFVHGKKERVPFRFLGLRFSKRQISFSLEKAQPE